MEKETLKESNDKLSKEWSGQNLENKTLLVLDEGLMEILFISYDLLEN